jgi:hypothetical protein
VVAQQGGVGGGRTVAAAVDALLGVAL